MAFILAFHLAGCDPGGDPEGDPEVFQEIDRNGDGQLTADDLDPRQAAIYLVRTRTSPEGDVTEIEQAFKNSDGRISKFPHFTPENEDAWAFSMPLVGRPTYYVAIIFKSPGPDPEQIAEGDGQGYDVGVDVPEREHGGESPFDGVMHIVDLVGETASGNVSVGIDVEIMSYVTQGPVGETIRIESAAFNRIPID
ncbi:MAG: EF-hand domain-containing protein [Myxococcota bacterium]|nr:EF-hand domain-containing protein [Myxococcota bacterium]